MSLTQKKELVSKFVSATRKRPKEEEKKRRGKERTTGK